MKITTPEQDRKDRAILEGQMAWEVLKRLMELNAIIKSNKHIVTYSTAITSTTIREMMEQVQQEYEDKQ